MTANEIITEVQRTLDKVPFSTESTESDADVVDSPSAAFSRPNLLSRINRGRRMLVREVKAQHVYNFIKEGTFTPTTNQLDAPSDITEGLEVDRPLLSRVFLDGQRCIVRNSDRHRRLESTGRQASSSYPVCVYEDGRLLVYPFDIPGVRSFYYVETPGDETDYTADLLLPKRLRAALIAYVVGSCYRTLQVPEMAAAYRSKMAAEIEPYRVSTMIHPIDQEVDTE